MLLDIWAEWCGPCKQLGPVLEKLEADYAGRFTLAKLDADKVPQISQQLSQMFGVRSIPFCVLFKDGQPVDGFVGAHPGGRDPRSSSTSTCPAPKRPRPRRQASRRRTRWPRATPSSALEKLQHAVATDPANDDARFDYVKLLLQQGRTDDAKVAFAPVIAKAATGAPLRLAAALDGCYRFRS